MNLSSASSCLDPSCKSYNIDPTKIYMVGSSAGGFVTRAGAAGDVLEQFFDEQFVNPEDTKLDVWEDSDIPRVNV